MANYVFITGIDTETFDEFVRRHPTKSHFLQSSTWGAIMEQGNYEPVYVALKEGKKIVAAALLLKRSLPMGYSYFYSPRGFVLDYDKKGLLEEFTKHVAGFVKQQKGIFLRIDPDVELHSLNPDGQVIGTTDRMELIDRMNYLGFRHRGFTQSFETEQPRFTFRIDLTQDLDVLFQNMSSTTRQRIKKGEKYQVNVRIGTEEDLHYFIHLMNETEERKSFSSHNDHYFQYFYKIFNEKEHARLFLGSVNPRKIISILEEDRLNILEQLRDLEEHPRPGKSYTNKKNELERQKETLDKELLKYQEYGLEYNDEVVISAHMIVYFGNKAWVLYAGNANILTTTYANYKVYYEHIKFAKENGITIYDQFGTIGPKCEDKTLQGLHDFKKKFGGTYTEFIGEFDYITNRFMYFLFQKVVPLYRKIKRKLVTK